MAATRQALARELQLSASFLAFVVERAMGRAVSGLQARAGALARELAALELAGGEATRAAAAALEFLDAVAQAKQPLYRCEEESTRYYRSEWNPDPELDRIASQEWRLRQMLRSYVEAARGPHQAPRLRGPVRITVEGDAVLVDGNPVSINDGRKPVTLTTKRAGGRWLAGHEPAPGSDAARLSSAMGSFGLSVEERSAEGWVLVDRTTHCVVQRDLPPASRPSQPRRRLRA